MQRVRTAIDSFCDKSDTCALILQGEAGMGKSRMIEETVECSESIKPWLSFLLISMGM